MSLRDDGNDQRQDPPKIYGLVENPRKGNNLGPFLRCSCAFGIDTVVAVGYDKCAVEGESNESVSLITPLKASCSISGSHGASKHVQLIAFPTHEQANRYLREVLGCSVIFGLVGPLPGGQKPRSLQLSGDTLVTFRDEYGQTLPFISLPLSRLQLPPRGNIAVAFTKNVQAVTIQCAEICDQLFHIAHQINPTLDPQRALVDAEACYSILLHQITRKASLREHSFDGHKFDIAVNGKQARDQALTEQRRVAREARRTTNKQDFQEASSGPDLFSMLSLEGDY